MNAQPEALELAEKLEAVPFIGFIYDGLPGTEDPVLCKQAAAELRRLHEVNSELVEALKAFDDAAKDSKSIIGFSGKALPLLKKARVAIAKATGENNG